MPYSVYVIRLRTEVLTEARVAKANPDRAPYKPCVYVGSTGLTPAQRYQKHLSARSGSKLVKKYHIMIHARITAKQPVFDTRAEAEEHERLLAERLRRKGYAVWQR